MVGTVHTNVFPDIGLWPIGTAQGRSLQMVNLFEYRCRGTLHAAERGTVLYEHGDRGGTKPVMFRE